MGRRSASQGVRAHKDPHRRVDCKPKVDKENKLCSSTVLLLQGGRAGAVRVLADRMPTSLKQPYGKHTSIHLAVCVGAVAPQVVWYQGQVRSSCQQHLHV